MPIAASSQSRTGKYAAGSEMSRRALMSSVGTAARIHSATRMPVAEVDHGSDTAKPTASQSTTAFHWPRSSRARRGRLEMRSVMDRYDYTGLAEAGLVEQWRQLSETPCLDAP